MVLRRTHLGVAALLLHAFVPSASEASFSHEPQGVNAFDGRIRGLSRFSYVAPGSVESNKENRKLDNDIFVHLDYDGDGKPPYSPTAAPSTETPVAQNSPTPNPSTATPVAQNSPTAAPSTDTPVAQNSPTAAPSTGTPDSQGASTDVDCPTAPAENANTATVDVEFEYNLETNNAMPYPAETFLAKGVEQVVVAVVAATQCGSSGRRGLRRLAEVTGVSSDHSNSCQGDCDVSSPSSLSCSKCRGVVTMEYVDTGNTNDAEAIEAFSLDTIQYALGDESFVGMVNQMQSQETGGIEATAITYTGPNANGVASLNEGVVASSEQKAESEITPGGKAVIALMAFFFVCLVLILCCIWRARRRAASEGDNKSLGTGDCSMDDNGSYQTTEFKDPGRHHSKLDVHECNSSLCQACNPRLGLGEIAEASYQSPETEPEIKFVKAEGIAGSRPSMSLLDLNISVDPRDAEVSEPEDLEEEKHAEDEDVEEEKQEVREVLAVAPPIAKEDNANIAEDTSSNEEALDLGLTDEDLGMAELNQEVTFGDNLDVSPGGGPASAGEPKFGRKRGRFRFSLKKNKAETDGHVEP